MSLAPAEWGAIKKRFRVINDKLDRLLSLAEASATREVKMAADLTNLEQELTQLKDAGDGMEHLLERVFAALEAEKTDPARVQKIIDEARAKKAEWIDATLRNTPADPNAPPPGPQQPQATQTKAPKTKP